ncbi:Protein PPP5D1 [Plecturocebus cupreus]
MDTSIINLELAMEVLDSKTALEQSKWVTQQEDFTQCFEECHWRRGVRAGSRRGGGDTVPTWLRMHHSSPLLAPAVHFLFVVQSRSIYLLSFRYTIPTCRQIQADVLQTLEAQCDKTKIATFILFYYLGDGVRVSLCPRLKYSGVIIAHCSLKPVGSRDPPTSGSQVASTTGAHNHISQIFLFLFFVEMGSCCLAQADIKLLDSMKKLKNEELTRKLCSIVSCAGCSSW